MGFFKTENCPYCGSATLALDKSSVKVENKNLCKLCYSFLVEKMGIYEGVISAHTVKEIREIVEQIKRERETKRERARNFEFTQMVDSYFGINENTKQFAVHIQHNNLTAQIEDMEIYNYSDILKFELLEDGNSVSSGGVGRALVGGVLFGGVGAIVGASTAGKKATCSKLQIKITTKNLEEPVIYINLLGQEVKKSSLEYVLKMDFAQEIISLLDIICQLNDYSRLNDSGSSSSVDEIRKYKQLMDDGIITEDEFNAKKKQLLGI